MIISIFGIRDKILIRKYKTYARKVLKQVNPKILKCHTALNIIIVNDKYIHKLNKQFLHRDRPTDVLSFEIDHPAPIDKNSKFKIQNSKFFDRCGVIGEIYISKDRARFQAQEQKISVSEEICNLIEHGILHLLGFSH